MKEPIIRCPKCEWRPKAESRWQCEPRCGTLWNTFWTGGVCPGCGKRWLHTQCPECHARSLHKDWYHFPEEEDESLKEEKTEKADA